MNKYRTLLIIIIIISISIFPLSFISCKQDPSTLRTYQLPENIGDGLDVGTIEEVGIDQRLIEKAINDIDRGKYGEVHSILIYKDEKLVVEEYSAGHKYQWDAPDHHADYVFFNSNTLHSIMSDTKSITSICIGIAIDEGFIESINQSIFDYLPEYQHLAADGKEEITIENLLTMTSGLDWKEWNAPYSSPENDAIGIWFSDKDPILYILEKSLVHEPGTHFTYAGGDIITLGEILRYASGMDIEEFSGKYLFEPLGIDAFRWADRFENGVVECASGLKLTPRSMVKIGITFLNDGTWNGESIISRQWVEKSAVTFPGNENIKVPGEDVGKAGYSYTWWTKEFEVAGKKVNGFWANGWGGQKIIVLPELDSVIVFTGGNYTSEVKNFSILNKYIFPAFS
ncbi:MAG: serine hydrolase [Actinomycetota bacterium]|nr:serine hydrolase [Actinomycetota bacterium]